MTTTRRSARRIPAPGAPTGIGGGSRFAVGVLAAVLFVVSGCTAERLPDRSAFGIDTPALERLEVDSDGHALTVWARVPESAVATVLLLHGRTWSSLPDFDLQVEGESLSLMQALAGEDIAVYALDARGYGATPRDESGWLDPDRMALDVVRVLEWLGEGTGAAPTVMGWSYGSTAAHLAAQRRPDLVAGVALYGYWKDPAALLPAQDDPADPPARATTEEAARSDFITPGSISDRAVDAFVAAALEADPVRVDVRRAHAFNALSPDSLTVPTLILQGELDPIAPSAVQERLFRGLGTAHKSWVVLPGCDHAAHLERCMPRFVRALAGFVREVAEPPTSEPTR
ncbi:alpha/beta fold hydrolase [Gemmatimonadota bacterium DH-20]|uniref:Alpha/beta fold hydrolase n=1 Tax=Gaopeijia maritima TaxID=3119007 RepID=A0ABU9E9D3_9BACT